MFVRRVCPRRALRLLVLFTCVCCLSAAFATDFYVSPTGLDTNPGTQLLPFQTINHALASIVPGDTIILLPGTFQERLNLQLLGATAEITTIKAQNPGQSIVDGGGSDYAIYSPLAVSNITLDGLVVTGSAEAGIFFPQVSGLKLIEVEVVGCYKGVWIQNGSQIEVDGCDVHDNRFGYLFGCGGEQGIAGLSVHDSEAGNNCYDGHTGNTDGFLVENNCTDVVLSNCQSHGHGDSGFDIKPENARLDRCLAYRNTEGGFKLWRSGVFLSNCLSHHNKGWGVIAAGNNLRFWNCTLADNGLYCLKIESTLPETVVVRNCILSNDPIMVNAGIMYNDNCNMYWNSPGELMLRLANTDYTREQLKASILLGKKSRVACPSFISPKTWNYGLKPTSKALGRGIWKPFLAKDLMGADRVPNKPVDLGALKGPAPVTPPVAGVDGDDDEGDGEE